MAASARSWARAAVLVALTAGAPSAATTRPNVVVILTDDMGYSDLGCFGGEIATPNLDRLAAGGLRYTRFYNTARCCPTRAALLTGLDSHQAGIGHMVDDRGFDGYRGDLSLRAPTIAEVLKPAGYRSYTVGKWHVTRHISPEGPKHNWPIARGFDRSYSTIVGAGNYFHPNGLTRDDRPIDPLADPAYKPESYYYTDALAHHAAGFVRDHAATRKEEADRPFFLYVAFTAAHWPMHARPEDIAKYKGKYDGGYDPARKARLARLKALGLLDPSWSPAPTVGDWSGVSDKAWEARGMEVYAAMVDRMDQGVGRIVAALEATGQLDNTLILYMQDNGGCAEDKGRDDAAERARMPGGEESYIGYGEGWANVSNTPFREYKHWTHEGGISTPMIAHWPAGIAPARRGGLEKEPAHLIDVMATAADLAGAARPSTFGGGPTKPLEGVSLRPTFEGKPTGRPVPLFWEHEGNRAVLAEGRWKLVAKHGEPWELYDQAGDRTEAHDLAASQPDRVRSLGSAWETWSKRVGVQPWGLIQARAKEAAAAKKKAARKAAAKKGAGAG